MPPIQAFASGIKAFDRHKMAKIDYMTHYHDCPWQIISRGDNRNGTLSSLALVSSPDPPCHAPSEIFRRGVARRAWGRDQSCSQLTGSTLQLKLFVAKNHLRSSSLSNCSLLVLLDNVQHALLKGLRTQTVWHCACALPSRDYTVLQVESANTLGPGFSSLVPKPFPPPVFDPTRQGHAHISTHRMRHLACT